MQIFAPLHDAMGGQVDNQRPKTQEWFGGFAGWSKADTQAGQKLANCEGFSHKVIGPKVKRHDLLHLLIPGRQYDDGQVRGLAQSLDHRFAVHVGQAEVEDDGGDSAV